MTQLQELNVSRPAVDMQVVRPLTFLLKFPQLYRCLICVESDRCWNALSMIHIGACQAAFDQAFKHRGPYDRPFLVY